jgi:hypothetical protein
MSPDPALRLLLAALCAHSELGRQSKALKRLKLEDGR